MAVVVEILKLGGDVLGEFVAQNYACGEAVSNPRFGYARARKNRPVVIDAITDFGADLVLSGVRLNAGLTPLLSNDQRRHHRRKHQVSHSTESLPLKRSRWPALEQLVATPLPLRREHVARVYTLPPIHKDPFDRILIAQAAAEGLALVTSDDH